MVGISFSFKETFSSTVLICSSVNACITLLLKPVLEDASIKLIGHNLKYDAQIMKKYNIHISHNIFDTMLAHYLINPETSHKLDVISESYLNHKTISIEDIIGKKAVNLNNESKVQICMEKSDLNFQLSNLLKNDLKKGNLLKLFEDIEMPLLQVLSVMEINGIKLNSSFLKELSVTFHKELSQLEKIIFEISNEEFNLASPKQLGEVLFNKMKIVEKPKKTKSGQFSTSEEVLSKLSGDHLIVEKVLEWRSLQKLLNTYVDALPKQINPHSLRIHAEFNQAVASTGRLKQ